MKLLHFRDRDAILRAAREKGVIPIQGHKVSFYPDFSNEIQKKRMQFLDVKKDCAILGFPMLCNTRLSSVLLLIPYRDKFHSGSIAVKSNPTSLARILGEIGFIDLWRSHFPNIPAILMLLLLAPYTLQN